MDNRKYNRGTIGNKGGRPTKADEQKLMERLSPLDDAVFEALKEAINNNEPYAIKLFFQYRYGMPKQIIEAEVNNTDNTITPFDIKEIYRIEDAFKG
jgi:hypothetical protein